MKLSGDHRFPAPRERVFAFLTDAERLSRCVPGCRRLETRAEGEFSGEVSVGLAAVKGLYKGTVKLEDVRPPAAFRMIVDGRGKQGFVRGSGVIELEAEAGTTRLRYAGDAQIGGPLAAVGQRMIEAAAKTMTTQFFLAMEAEVAAAPGEVVRQGFWVSLWRLLVKLLHDARDRLVSRRPALAGQARRSGSERPPDSRR